MKVILLDLDAARPDHFGCYGYNRNTTPNIDKIASEGVIFNNYYTSDAPCAPSRNALMTGRFGIHTGNVGHGGTAGDIRLEGKERGFQDQLATDSLPMIFRREGCHTVLFSPFPERHSSWQFYAGFNEIHNTGGHGMESAEEVSPQVLEWLENKSTEDDWFLYINYWDAHTPYRVPEEYGNPFEKEPLPDWLTEDVFAEHLDNVGPHGAREINMFDNASDPNYPRHPGEITNRKELKDFIDNYDTGLRYIDEHIGRINDILDEKGIKEETIIIVTSDHGENLGELGLYAEHGTADHITCRIPMIIKWPGMQKGYQDHDLHYHLDLLPTLADLLHQEKGSSWDGKSYAPVISDGKSVGRDYLVVSQCAHVCQRGVRFGDWMYIRTYHDGYHLFDKEMLFNIKEDPHEQDNLAEQRKDICKEAVYLLMEWHDEMMDSMDNPTDPLWTVMKEGGPFHARGELKKYIKRLEETGREDAIPLLIERHPQELL